MKTSIGLTEAVRHEVGRILNRLLADEYVLYATTRDYHWNVAGPEFHSLHQLFEAQYEEIADWIDEIAERARAIGVGAHGSWTALTKTARLSAGQGIGCPPSGMIHGLLSLHEKIIVQLRTDTETCTEHLKDSGTADFLTGLMAGHEKSAWMLRSHLESGNKKTGRR